MNCTNGAKQEYVPMVWGRKKNAELASFTPLATSTAILGYNEPNLRSQSNLTAAAACSLWPTVLTFAKKHKLRVGSPAANHCNPKPKPGGQDSNCFQNSTAWFDDFFKLPGCGLDTIDFLTTHKYGCNATSTIDYVKDLSARYKKPVWLTEFSCADAPAAKQLAFAKKILPVFDSLPSTVVERYAWFAAHAKPGSKGVATDSLLMPSSNKLTPLGEYYNSE
jgi:hypothetical protein